VILIILSIGAFQRSKSILKLFDKILLATHKFHEHYPIYYSLLFFVFNLIIILFCLPCYFIFNYYFSLIIEDFLEAWI